MKDMVNRVRNKSLNIRFNSCEYDFIKMKYVKSGKSSLREFFLSLAKKAPFYVCNQRGEILFELKKQGNNLNQIARRLNSGEDFSHDMAGILEEYYKFVKSFQRIFYADN